MSIFAKSIPRHLLIASVVFLVGFVLSSGMVLDVSKKLSDKVMPGIKERLYHHIFTLEVDAKHYFLISPGGYLKELHTQPLPFAILAGILFNSVFNILFQPVFLCPFTPQVIVNVILLPFFLYGAVRYFKKTWVMLGVFFLLSFQVGIYDAGVEALVRHGMVCELIYLLIGSAGFTGWITRNS